MKNPITPAGMTYERAFEIALAAVGPVEPKPLPHEKEDLHALGYSDRRMARELGLSKSGTSTTRYRLGLAAHGKGGRQAA